ncbi:MAG: hypothetical protein ABR510_01025 [Trueperaceae bacterium]
MIEDSVEGFVARWRAHAVHATAFARAEGSPLLELGIGDAVVQTLERTGPYLAPTGPVQVVLHAMTRGFEPATPDERRLGSSGLGRLEVAGVVVEREGAVAVIDAGHPLVVGLDDPAGEAGLPEVGAWVSCVSMAPVHAFVLPAVRASVIGVPTDELV